MMPDPRRSPPLPWCPRARDTGPPRPEGGSPQSYMDWIARKVSGLQIRTRGWGPHLEHKVRGDLGNRWSL